jgi:hypothetical protein
MNADGGECKSSRMTIINAGEMERDSAKRDNKCVREMKVLFLSQLLQLQQQQLVRD